MVSGRPGPRGDYNPVTAPGSFPASWDQNVKKTYAMKMLHNSSQTATTTDVYTEDIEVGQCEGFTFYVSGTGDWNIQYSPHPNNNESFWVDASVTDQSDEGFLSVTSRHPWTRAVIRSGSNLIVWIYRKYATY